MLKNQELLDFEVDVETGKVCVLDAPDANDSLLTSLGLGGPNRDAAVTATIGSRRLSPGRDDIDEILSAFGARSSIELAFMGYGLSFSDKLWYRAPCSSERWENINFYDNDWDGCFRTAVLTHDYEKLRSCSPDVPDVTTAGYLRKAWERSGERVQLLKEPLFESGADLKGARLGAKLCEVLYGRDASQPLHIVERYGRRLSASPLMVGRDEELIQGWRLLAMAGYDANESAGLMGSASPQSLIEIISRAGVANALAHVAKIFAFKDLALLADFHAGNLGIIRDVVTGACQPAPPFDYDRAFGFPFKGFPFEIICSEPKLATLLCARSFSDLDSSWDWSWYDPQALEGFEERIVKAYANCADCPSNFGELVSCLFATQRAYVNKVAST